MNAHSIGICIWEREREIYIYRTYIHIYTARFWSKGSGFTKVHLYAGFFRNLAFPGGTSMIPTLLTCIEKRMKTNGVCLPTFPWTLPYLSWRISLFEALFCVGISKINLVEISADSWGCMFMSSGSYIHLTTSLSGCCNPLLSSFIHTPQLRLHFFAPSLTPKKRWEGSPPSTKEQI